MEKSDVTHPINTILNGSNYVLWSQEMTSFFKGRKLWRYVTGDIRIPAKDNNEEDYKFSEQLEEWDCLYHQILTWLRNTCIPSIKIQFGRFETAQEVWKLLAKRYSTTNAIHRFQLYGTLSQMHQKSGQSINDFLSEMNALWDQLSSSEPLWHDMRDAELYIKERDEFRVYQFTLALNDEFESVRSSLLLRDPFPKFDTVVAELLVAEARLTTLRSHQPIIHTDSVLATSSSQIHIDSVLATPSQWKATCRYFHKSGHVIYDCLKLKGKQRFGHNNQSKYNSNKIQVHSTAAVATENSSSSDSTALHELLSQIDVDTLKQALVQSLTGTPTSSVLSTTRGSTDGTDPWDRP